MSRKWRIDREEPGLQRVGYDADTQRSYYRDQPSEQLYWRSIDNVQGHLQPIGRPGQSREDHDRESLALRWRATEAEREWWRGFAPFMLIIISFMGFIIWWTTPTRAPTHDPVLELECPEAAKVYTVSEGDTCYGISHDGKHLEDLLRYNSGLDCDKLVPGQTICVPI